MTKSRPTFSHGNQVFYVRIPYDWNELVLRRKSTWGMRILDERDCIFECSSVILNACN